MARVGISFEQVSQAAHALVAAGKTPTIAGVREALGGTGSPNTIHKHLTDWKTERPQAPAAAHALPSRLVDAIASEIERATAEAKAAIQEQLTQAQAESVELARAGEHIEAERDELAAQIVQVTKERDEANATATERGAEIERQAQQIHREQQAAEGARVDLAKTQLKIESHAEKLTEQAQEIERLKADLATANKERQDAMTRAAVLAAELAASERRANEAIEREKVTVTKLDDAEKQGRQAMQDANHQRLQVMAQQTALDSAARDLESYQHKASKAKRPNPTPAKAPIKKAPAKTDKLI